MVTLFSKKIEENRFSIGYSHLYNQTYLPLSSLGLITGYKGKINFGFKYTSFKVDYEGAKLLNENMMGVVSSIYLLKDKNSSLSIGISANHYSIKFGESAGTSGDGSNGIGKESIEAFGLDIGILASLRNKNRIGVFIKNIISSPIGVGMSNQSLPKKIDIGFSTIPFRFPRVRVFTSLELIEKFHIDRFKAALIIFLIIWFVGLGNVFSFNLLAFIFG